MAAPGGCEESHGAKVYIVSATTTFSTGVDLPAIMGYGVMSTPGVVIDGQVVHAGGVPARSKVEGWF